MRHRRQPTHPLASILRDRFHRVRANWSATAHIRYGWFADGEDPLICGAAWQPLANPGAEIEVAPADRADAPERKLIGARPMYAKRNKETSANGVRVRQQAKEAARLLGRQAARRSAIGIRPSDGNPHPANGDSLSVTSLPESTASLAFAARARLAPVPVGAVRAALEGLRRKAGVSPELALPTHSCRNGSGEMSQATATAQDPIREKSFGRPNWARLSRTSACGFTDVVCLPVQSGLGNLNLRTLR